MVVEYHERQIPLHQHDFPHWVLVLSGSVRLLTTAYEREISAGAGVLIPSGLLHELTPQVHGTRWINFQEE